MIYFLWACALGALSAISLPLGSWIGLKFKFTNKQIAILAAFGAGALLAALSVELIAPTTLALVEEEGGYEDEHMAEFLAMVFGCIAGGALYILLDNLVNKQGGFLRKTSTLLNHYKKYKKEKQMEILEQLSKIPLFHNFPPEHVETLMELLEPVIFKEGDKIMEEGEPAEAAFIIQEGEISVSIKGTEISVLTPDQIILNLIPILGGTPSIGTGLAKTKVKALRLSKSGFTQLRQLSSDFDAICLKIGEERLEQFGKLVVERTEKVIGWTAEAKDALSKDIQLPSDLITKQMKDEHHGSPIAIWLGILLDGIPESLVIGAGMLAILTVKLAAGGTVGFADVIPFTLIAGLFLSNFPEALSSSANMKAQGWTKKRIFLMWFSLMVITGLGAGVGYLIAGEMPHTWMVMLEGMAAGAMLTMIAAAMIPEAVLMGSGNLVGISTLAGFLGAILFKLLE